MSMTPPPTVGELFQRVRAVFEAPLEPAVRAAFGTAYAASHPELAARLLLLGGGCANDEPVSMLDLARGHGGSFVFVGIHVESETGPIARPRFVLNWVHRLRQTDDPSVLCVSSPDTV